MIMLSGLISASNTDLLQGTRLQTAPSNGYVVVEVAANEASVTNQFNLSVQLPSGDTPLTDVMIPNSGSIGRLDKREQLRAVFPVQQGGHLVLGFVETGTCTATYRVTFTKNLR